MKQSELLRHIADNEEKGIDWNHGLICKTALSWQAVMSNPEAFTLKPRTHTVNGFEVPAPMTEAGNYYWLVNIDGPFGAITVEWEGDIYDNHRLKYGLCFATKEHAELNRKAQLKINPYGEGEE